MPIRIGDQGGPMNRGASASGGGGGGLSVVDAITSGVKALLSRSLNPFSVTLPSNTFNPEGADTFDIERLVTLDAGATEAVISYTALESQTIRFIRYGVFTNVVLGDNVRFLPTINGNRILKFHGDPMNDFAIYLSVGPDLTENSLRQCDVTLSPGQTLQWVAKNLSGAKAEFGVRMRGYLINQNSNPTRGFGG